MTTQEDINEGLTHLLMMAIEFLKSSDNQNLNFISAQNLVRQAFFKYLDLADCPFRQTCITELIANGYVREG